MKEQVIKTNEAFKNFLKIGDTTIKNKILCSLSDAIFQNSKMILKENQKDIREAKKKKLSKAFIDRLALDEKRIKDVADACLQISNLPDPIGKIENMKTCPDGFKLGRRTCPIGVVLMIYEARPSVTVEAFSLLLKAGNGTILRGGSDAYFSNLAFLKCIKLALKENNIDENLILYVEGKDEITKLLGYDELIHLVIPRGGESLIKSVVQASKIPVLKHYKGVCHVYVNEFSDLKMAEKICVNAKAQRCGVCNSMETMLVDESISKEFLKSCLKKMEKAGVKIIACSKTKKIYAKATLAKEDDWYAEYLDLILSVKIVKNIDEAIEHINKYGSSHTDSIVTENINMAEQFLQCVDSSSVMVNASTRLSDGGVYGLGAEIGISTDKLHARGPMGLEELSTKKWIVIGNGNIRE